MRPLPARPVSASTGHSPKGGGDPPRPRWRPRLSIFVCLVLAHLGMAVLYSMMIERYAPVWAREQRGLVLVLLSAATLGASLGTVTAHPRMVRMLAVMALIGWAAAWGVAGGHVLVWHLLSNALRTEETAGYVATLYRADLVGSDRFAMERSLLQHLLEQHPEWRTVAWFARLGALLVAVLPWITVCFSLVAPKNSPIGGRSAGIPQNNLGKKPSSFL